MNKVSGNFREKMNRWGREERPFLFLLDFALQRPVVIPLDVIDPDDVLYDINGTKNFEEKTTDDSPVYFTTEPASRARYCRAFSRVQQYVRHGDTFLLIRFIENTDAGLIYKSGGGITAQSRCEEEYNELIEKIYVPFA